MGERGGHSSWKKTWTALTSPTNGIDVIFRCSFVCSYCIFSYLQIIEERMIRDATSQGENYRRC